MAENGCAWLPEADMLHRALPTIAQHLALVLPATSLVATMHQAYARLASQAATACFWPAPPKRPTSSSRW